MIQDIYDFESVLSTAFTTVLAGAGLVVVNLNTNPILQRPRPRVDLFFHSHGQVIPVIFATPQVTGDWPRAGAYRGELKLQASTNDVNAEGKTTHGAYRAKVRSLGAVMGNLVNTPAVIYSQLTLIVDIPTPMLVDAFSPTPHGLSNGDLVVISRATDSILNGVFAVTVVTANQFEYTLPSPGLVGGVPTEHAQGYKVSSVPLRWHKVQFITEAATSFSIAADKSYEMSTISYNVDFSVANNAWPLLTQQ